MKKKSTLLLIFWFLLCYSSSILAANIKVHPVEDAKIQFDGMVVPGDTFRLFLRPGEEVIQLGVNEGQSVREQDVVARLFNQKLYSLYNDCIDKEIRFINMTFSLKKLQTHRESLLTQNSTVSKRLQKLQQLEKTGINSGLNSNLFQLQEKERNLLFEISAINHEIDRQQEILSRLTPTIRRSKETQKAVGKKIDALKIQTKISGVVKKVHPEPQRANAGDLLVEIWDTSKLLLEAEVSQDHVEALNVGAQVRIYFNYYNNEFEMGEIVKVGDGKKRLQGTGQGWTFFPVSIRPLSNQSLRIGNQAIIRSAQE